MEQRHVAVRRVTRDDLDVPLAVSPPGTLRRTLGEGLGDVAVDPPELFEQLRVDVGPALGQVDHVAVGLIKPLELGLVLLGALDAVLEEVLEAVLEVVVGELFEEDGGEPHGELGVAVEERALVEHREDGQVGLGRGLVEPVLAVWPGAVAQDVGQVAVQDEAEGAEGGAHAAYLSGGCYAAPSIRLQCGASIVSGGRC